MKRLESVLEKRWAGNLLAACAAVVLYVLLNHLTPILRWLGSLWKILSPIVIGLVLAYLLDPVAKFFERTLFRRARKESTRRTLSVILTVVCVILLLALFLVMLVPSLIQSVSGLVENSGKYYTSLTGVLDELSTSKLGELLDLNALAGSAEDLLKEFLENLSAYSSVILNTTKNIGASVFNGAIGAILALYFLLGKKPLLSALDRLRCSLLRRETYESRGVFWKRCHEIFIRYIGCTLLDGVIIGTANAIFMVLFGMPYAALVSVIVGITNLLPTFGPIIGAVLGCFILVLDRPVNALIFLIFTLVLQALDGYVLKPRLFSSSFGIPAVWTLIAIILGGKLFGIAGILLAIPVAAVIAFLYEERFLPWLTQILRNKCPHCNTLKRCIKPFESLEKTSCLQTLEMPAFRENDSDWPVKLLPQNTPESC